MTRLWNLYVIAMIFLFPPSTLAQKVKIWEESKVIPTWEIGPPEVNPTFPWSGRDVYPYALKEIITDQKSDKEYQTCWLENEFIQVLVLPEIGGRLHGAKDKTNDYNFFYWQPTIKPALISMTGAWISGGIEWNYPHGHRPTCYSPVSYRLVENPDGSATIWVGETEWMFRLRWIIGLTVYPGKSLIEAKVRLSNPTPIRQSYQMWATTAVNANEDYQAIYPSRVMTGHGKREFWRWPVDNGVDISWWNNIPNASSFFTVEPGNFFGGYDHGQEAGTVITGNPRVVIGKKLWTWGTSPFGRMWEPILTEDQGPYFEPQAGAYSDNQPDNHWIEPGEIKTYSHFFFPVRGIGGFAEANINGALNLEISSDDKVRIGAYSTSVLKQAQILLESNGTVIFDQRVDLDPGKPFSYDLEFQGASDNKYSMVLRLKDMDGKELIRYSTRKQEELPLPEPLEDFADPDQIESSDALWHAGDITYKFRDFEKGKDYFEEAVRRDPGDSRSRISLAEMAIKRADYKGALEHLAIAEKRDPDTGKLFYLRGLANERLGQYDAAYDQFYRATHFEDYLARAYEWVARLDLRRKDAGAAVEHTQKAIEKNVTNPQLWALKATALRLAGEDDQARKAAEHAVELDPLHPWAFNELRRLRLANGSELGHILRNDFQCLVELALQYANCGLYDEASEATEAMLELTGIESSLAAYYNGFFRSKTDESSARAWFERASRLTVDNEFAFRLEAIDVFQTALRFNPEDNNAHYFLGLIHAGLSNLEGAAVHWEKAVKLNPKSPRAQRNLGLVYLHQDLPEKALLHYQQAFSTLPDDSRILMELDEVKEQLGISSEERLSFLKKHLTTVETRDELLTSMLDLMVQSGENEDALQYYRNHHFHNWEGRYTIHNAYMEACLGLAENAEDPSKALEYFKLATEYPQNLEVAPREPDLRGFLYYPMAKLYRQTGSEEEAERLLEITSGEGTEEPTLASYYQSLALRDLGKVEQGEDILRQLRKKAEDLISDRAESPRWNSDSRKALGHYYQSLIEEAEGEPEKASRSLELARELEPLIARRALVLAQISYAGTHQ